MHDVERMVRLGWAEWNRVTGEISWTGQVYEIFGTRVPLPLDEFPDHVHPEDAADVSRAITALTELHRPQSFEFRVGERHVAATAEPVLDNFGRPIAFRGVVQDITARRRIEDQLAQSRLELEWQRLRLAENMQRALLPEARPALPGLRVAVRYHPAENTAQVGGDWYEATTLPDGRVLIAVGDASGHGLPAAARMAQLRSALLGVTGAGPAGILHCLNRLVLHVQEQTATATAVVAHFDPATRRFTWLALDCSIWSAPAAPAACATTSARRPAPSGRPTTAPPPPCCAPATWLLYTDGLVERRGGDLADPAHALRRMARSHAAATPEQMLAAFDIGNAEDDTCVLSRSPTTSTDGRDRRHGGGPHRVPYRAASRAAATAAWPRLIPPSLGGTRGGEHPEARAAPARRRRASSSSRFWNTPPDSATLPTRAGPRAAARLDDRSGDPVVEPGGDDRLVPRARSSTTARTRSRAAITSGGPPFTGPG